MLGRLGKLLLLGFFVLWLGVVLPGHTRGAIRVPGPVQAPDSCCASTATKSPQPKAPSIPDPVRSCAICYLTLTLDIATTPNLDLPQAGCAPAPPEHRLPVAPAIDAPRLLPARAPPFLNND